MTQPSFSLSQDAYNAFMLRSVMDATAVVGETAEEAMVRSAAIVEMFRAFEAANAMESMVACHCISLRFMLEAAMRDAGNLELEPVLLTRMRGMATSISKNLHLWIAKFETLHARNEARATEARQLGAPRAEAIARPNQGPVPRAVNVPPAGREPPRPMAPLPSLAPPFKRPDVPAAALPRPAAREEKTPGMKDALFASAAAVSGTPANGRLNVAPGR